MCDELGEVKSKAYTIGIRLGIPREQMVKFKQEGDVLSSAVDYWLCGNVKDVPVTWAFLAEALDSDYVGASGCAKKIREKYIIQHEESKHEQGLTS